MKYVITDTMCQIKINDDTRSTPVELFNSVKLNGLPPLGYYKNATITIEIEVEDEAHISEAV